MSMWEWNKTIGNKYWEEPASEMYFLAEKWYSTDKTLLDIGAGIGRNAIYFAKCGYTVTALDSSQDGLNHIKEKCDFCGLKINLVNSDMHILPFADESFDSVIAFHSIYHTDMEGLRQVIKEIRRVLNPGGEMYITLLSTEDSEFKEKISEAKNQVLIKQEEEGSFLKHVYLREENVFELFSDDEIQFVKLIKDFFNSKNPCHYHVLAKKENR